MGYCYLFPWLCGMRMLSEPAVEIIAKQKQILLSLISELETALDGEEDIATRIYTIDRYRSLAIIELQKHGMSPYKIEVAA